MQNSNTINKFNKLFLEIESYMNLAYSRVTPHLHQWKPETEQF